MIYVYDKFHMPRWNSSLVIANKPKARYKYHAATFLFHIL